MLYKFEPHMHTSEGSACSNTCGADMADAHKAAGYDGIVVTDHFFNGNCAVDRSLPWEEKIDLYCLGYENAKKRGDEIGLKVFFGWEFTYAGSDFLTYGLDKAWLKKHPEIMDMPIYDYADFVRSEGALVVHAHPFRQYFYIKKITLIPDKVDAVEICNASHRIPEFNERAKWYAESYGLPVTAGSDSHDGSKLLLGGIGTNFPIDSLDDYASAVRERRITALYDRDGEIY